VTSYISSLGEPDNAASLGITIFLFCAYFLALEAAFLTIIGRTAARRQVSKRLWTDATPAEQLQDLIKIRRGRGLAPSGDFVLPGNGVNRLMLQSGTEWGVPGLVALFIGGSVVIFGVTYALSREIVSALVMALLGGAGVVYFLLMRMRNARLRKLEEQLPEAIDILVRSLKAGHPILPAIRLVARELPDPIGAEFRILADEITYGLDLETAMNNLAARVGQEDLTLVVIAAGIQASAGGNLAEILGNMSHLVRERLKMRMKIKAMSAEGRVSALILSILPFALFAILWLIAPSFYGDVWDQPVVKPMLFAAAVWLFIGNVVMQRMVRFRI
jgi:tight adherence protein B